VPSVAPGASRPPPRREGLPHPGQALRRTACVRRLRFRLLDLDGGAGLLQLGLDRVGLLAVDALLDRVRGTVDQVLRLLEAEARDRADDLDHLDLLATRVREHDVERRLLLARRGAVAAA